VIDRAMPSAYRPDMDLAVWFALLTLFLAGGLTPGPAVMLVTTSSMRYGFWPAMLPALGICAANLLWVALAAAGASAFGRAFPAGFAALKLVGLVYIAWLAYRMAFSGAVDLTRREPPPRARLFGRGVGLQIANPNAMVYFGGLLPAYIDAGRSLLVQGGVIMATITTTELIGLLIYAAAANELARRFASTAFALWFCRGAALAMAGSAAFAVYATWAVVVR
jgi:threonine/homoserine/homoserine lactone efflux protein